MAVSLGEEPDPVIPSQPPPRTDGKLVTVRMPTFTVLDAVFMVTSMLTLVADVGTDLNLVVRYFLGGSVTWAVLTLAVVVVASVVVAVVSLRWHLADDSYPVTKTHWVANICLWGILHRYVVLFGIGLRARKTRDPEDFRELRRQQSDACILRVFESFLEAAPQLVLQLYIMLSYNDYSIWTGITAVSSLASLGWGVAAYTKAMRNTRPNKHKMSVPGLVLQTVWQAGTIAARVAALALAATVLQIWILLIMGLHFMGMFIWVVSQKTGFSKTKWEENAFNFIMAVTYCFCFFNLKEGKSRWRMLMFYTVTIVENICFALAYYFMSPHKLWVKNVAIGLVFSAMSLGLACMLLYYRFFHPVGPIKLSRNMLGVAEKGQLSGGQTLSRENSSGSVCPSPVRRGFKYLYPVGFKPSNSVLSAPGVSLKSSPTSSALASPEGAASPTPTLPHRHPGTMCSVQDLLANVSCSSNIEAVAGDESVTEGTADFTAYSPESNRTVKNNDNLSPSSFERSVTREFNLRLSASEMKDCKTELVTSETEMRDESDKNDKVIEQNKSELYDTCQIHGELGCANLAEVEHSEDGGSEKPIDSDTMTIWENKAGHQKSCSSSVRQVPAVISSPNNVGVPLQSKYSSQTSLDGVSRNEVQRRSASILRTSVRGRSYNSETDVRLTSLPHLTNSTINVTSKSQVSHECSGDAVPPARQVPNVELAVIDRMHIIEVESSGVSSEGQSDYENIYERKEDQRRDLPPKPINLVVQNLNETQSTQSSIPHDYENICAININREMLGVRHWKTYTDIEDRVHDNSTFKDRLKLLDSTLASSLYADYNSIMKGIQSRRSISMIDDGESVLSRSLPDLSSVRLETCLEETEEEKGETSEPKDVKDDTRLMDVLNHLRANRPMNKSSSVDDIPNYESIWIGDINKPESEHILSQVNSTTSKSSLVVTIGDVRAKESLCNLYYSTLSDLSYRYYSERMRRNYSIGSLASPQSTRSSAKEMMRAISVPDNKTLLEVSELIEEQRKQDEEMKALQSQGNGSASSNIKARPHQLGTTPVRSEDQSRHKRKFSVLRDRFEHPHWTPLKSPLRRRQTAQRRNSLQDRTAKALQAGMKVFRRPRVHVITPKKDDNKDKPYLKSPFKSKTVTPTIPAIKKSMDTPKQSKERSEWESEVPKSGVQQTPKVRTPMDRRLTKGTPKTSTPDDTKHNSLKKDKTNIISTNAKKLLEGPKTSTPEGNKQLPQISILSAISSVVASPENVQPRMPLSENVHQNRINTQIQPRQIIRDPDNMQVLPAKCVTNMKSSRVPHGNENIFKGLCPAQSALNIQSVQSHYSFKTVHSSSRENLRCLTSQPMFSGALGLSQFQPDTRQTLISVSETLDTPHPQQNISISHIILSSPQSPEINMQKSTLSPNSKIFSRRI